MYTESIFYVGLHCLNIYIVPGLHVRTNIRNIRTFSELPGTLFDRIIFPELQTPTRFGNNGHIRYSNRYNTRRIPRESFLSPRGVVAKKWKQILSEGFKHRRIIGLVQHVVEKRKTIRVTLNKLLHRK